MRVFISIGLPEKVKKKIKKVQKELERQHLFIGNFIKPENLHLTLKFLGEISEEKTEEVVKKLREIDYGKINAKDRKSTRLNSSHIPLSRMPSSA